MLPSTDFAYYTLTLCRFACCKQKVKDTASLSLAPGCKKSKHCSEHHENYVYSAYTTYIGNEVRMHACVFMYVHTWWSRWMIHKCLNKHTIILTHTSTYSKHTIISQIHSISWVWYRISAGSWCFGLLCPLISPKNQPHFSFMTAWQHWLGITKPKHVWSQTLPTSFCQI